MSQVTASRSGTLASVDPEGVLVVVRQRIADGESPPVLCSDLDALGLPGVVEALAREESP